MKLGIFHKISANTLLVPHSLELAYMLESIEGGIENGVDEVVEAFGEKMGKVTDTKVVYQIIYL